VKLSVATAKRFRTRNFANASATCRTSHTDTYYQLQPVDSSSLNLAEDLSRTTPHHRNLDKAL